MGETGENLKAAQADYEQAIELNETNAEACLGLADVHIRRGAYEKAIAVLQRGLEKTGENSDTATKLEELQEDYLS